MSQIFLLNLIKHGDIILNNDTYMTSLKDSLPYFTVLFLFSDLAQVEWMVLILTAAIFIADLAGYG